MIEVALLTVNEGALVVPNFTAVAAVKLLPVMATLVPPVGSPPAQLLEQPPHPERIFR